MGTGKVDSVDKKNGMSVYGVNLTNGSSYWGYRDQFEIIPKVSK